MRKLSKTHFLTAMVLWSLLALSSVTSASDSGQAVSKEVYDRIQHAQGRVESKDYQGALRDLNDLYDPAKLTEYEQANVLNYIGFLHYNMQDIPGAIRTYEKMVSIPSLEPQMGKTTTYTLAQLYTMEKQYQKALDMLDDWFVMEADPAPESFIFKAQTLYRLQRHIDMIEPIENAMRIASERGQQSEEDWYVLLNFAYFQEENFEKVRDIQNKLLENWPKERYVKSLVGAYAELGEWESALETVDGWFATNAVAEPDLYVTKAHILKQLQRYDEMVHPLEQAMAIADERGIEIEDEWRTLLASAQSPGRPNFCSLPPPDSAKPGTNPTGFRIGNIEGRWARWEWWVKDRSPRLKEEMARLSVDDIQSEIADFCTAKTLRWHLTNLVNKQAGVAQCFLDTGKIAELVDLSKSLKVPARRAGGYFVFDGCRDSVLDPEKCRRIDSLVDELSQKPSETCERYYADQVYANFIGELRARDKRLAEARAAEQQRLAQKREAQEARQAAEAEADRRRFTYFANTGVTENSQVVWGSKHGSSSASNRDPLEAFNQVNSEYLQSLTIPSDQATFTPPEKGEFEKTADYERRVASLRQEHQSKISGKSDDLASRRSEIFSSAWNEHIGPPTLSDLSYNADDEVFTAMIASKAGYRIPISLAVPIAEAQKRKTELSKMRPWVMLEFDGERLTPRSVILQYGSSILEVPMTSAERVPFAFSQSQLASYNDERDARQQREEGSSNLVFNGVTISTFYAAGAAMIYCDRLSDAQAQAVGDTVRFIAAKGGIPDSEVKSALLLGGTIAKEDLENSGGCNGAHFRDYKRNYYEYINDPALAHLQVAGNAVTAKPQLSQFDMILDHLDKSSRAVCRNFASTLRNSNPGAEELILRSAEKYGCL